MKPHSQSAAVNLATEPPDKSEGRLPVHAMGGGTTYSRRAWFVADEPAAPWKQIKAILRVAWDGQGTEIAPILESVIAGRELMPQQKPHGYASRSGPRPGDELKNPSNHDVVPGAEYEEWSVGRRLLQDQTKSGREPFRDPFLDYGSQG